jgi:hypothetical protein
MIDGSDRRDVIKGPPAYPDGSIWQLRLLVTPVVRYGGRGDILGEAFDGRTRSAARTT